MPLGKQDDPFFFCLSDSITSTITNPWGQGDAAVALRVVQAGDSSSSVFATNPIAQGDSATALRVVHAGDVVASVYAQNPIGQGDTTTALRIVHAGDSAASVFATNPIAQGDAATALRVVLAGNADASVSVRPSAAGFETTSDVLRTFQVGDAITSVFVTGSFDSMTAWLARTTNPTAKADGADVRPTTDKVGRQLIMPYQMRDLIATAYITLSTSAGYNTETTLIAIGAAGVSNDILTLSGTNDSTVAAFFDIRCGTANAGVTKRIQIPASANGIYHEDFNVPLIGEVTTPWTVKAFISGGGAADVTGNNVTLSALYVKNV